MLKESKGNMLEYKKLSREEMDARHILGRLEGICCDCINATRNGRKYSEELWEKVFESPLMKERIANRVCYGELGHPADREETDMEKVAICLAEQPVKGSDGKLRAVFDILDTNNGRILKTLCEYGSTLGISSRGSGDLITDYDGQEAVDPDTYQCEGFDVVIIPAVEEARLNYVTESLSKKRYNKTLRQSLTESLKKANENDRKKMEESLESLGINLEEDMTAMVGNQLATSGTPLTSAVTSEGTSMLKVESMYTLKDGEWKKKSRSKEESVSEQEENNADSVVEDTEEVGNAVSNEELLKEFQEALKKVKELERDNLTLKEQLSVSNAKEVSLKEELSRYKKATISLGGFSAKSKESINEMDKELSSNKEEISKLNESIRSLRKSKMKSATDLENANEYIEQLTSDYESEKVKLESISDKLKESQLLAEKYRKSYKTLKEAYVNAKADYYGVDRAEARKKLGESYKIDQVDELLRTMKVNNYNMSKLPYRIDESTKVTKNLKLKQVSTETNPDDNVSDSLLDLLG